MVLIHNIPSNTISVEHSLIRFLGQCDRQGSNDLTISVISPSGSSSSASSTSAAGITDNHYSSDLCVTQHNGGFIAWALLREYGDHAVTISDGGKTPTANVTVHYKKVPHDDDDVPRCELFLILPPENEITNKVDSQQDACIIQGPNNVDCTLVGAKKRIQMTGLLLQTFVFEDLKCGRTFLLGMEDSNNNIREDGPSVGMPRVNCVHLKIPTADFHRLGNNWTDGGQEGYRHVNNLVNEYNETVLRCTDHRKNIKNIVWMGPTRYDAVTKKVVGQTALGGGNLALFGTGTLHCNPDCVAEFAAAFTDASFFSDTLLDDSGHRGRVRCWTCATGVGAQQHELGHVFGAKHSRRGIMARGFDDYDCFVVATKRNFNGGGADCQWYYSPRGAHFDPDSRRLHTYTKFAYHSQKRGFTGGYVLSNPPKDLSLKMECDKIQDIFECNGNGNVFVVHGPYEDGVMICSECNSESEERFTFVIVDRNGYQFLAKDKTRNCWIKVDEGAVYYSSDFDCSNPSLAGMKDAGSKGNFHLLYLGSWRNNDICSKKTKYE